MTQSANLSEPAVLVDPSKNIFKVARRNFVDPDILAAEKERIFERCWLYLGHGSEIAKPGDFVTRNVAGRGILFTRDAKGEARAMAEDVLSGSVEKGASARKGRASEESRARPRKGAPSKRA